jgi:hypothetical protein
MSSVDASVASAVLDFVLTPALFSVDSDFLLAGSEPRCSDTVTVTASLPWAGQDKCFSATCAPRRPAVQ